MMEYLLTLGSFLFIVLGLGYGLLWLLKARHEHPAIAALEMAAAGLALFPLLGILFVTVGLPLDKMLFFLFALAGPAVSLIFRKWDRAARRSPSAASRETSWCVLALVFVLVAFFLFFWHGATAYPYLENDDPWQHAAATNYVAFEKTYEQRSFYETTGVLITPYLEPYPPSYDLIMGVMRQTNDTTQGTLKFTNVALITLGLAFCYLFFREYLKNDRKALFATILLAALPSFIGHFIFSQVLAIVLIPAALYALLRALDDKRWRIPAIVLIASELVTQPVVSFLFGIIVLLLIALLLAHETWREKRPKKLVERYRMSLNAIIAGAGGVVLSFLFWGVQLARWGIEGFFALRGKEFTSGWAGSYALQRYPLKEIIFAPHASRIDQATGFGLVVFLLVVVGMLLFVLTRRSLDVRKGWVRLHLLIWFLALAYAVFAPSLNLPGWGSSRLWACLAIPLAGMATEGAFGLSSSITKSKGVQLGILLLLVVGILATSLPAKVAVQTAQWPPGAHWSSMNEFGSYLEMSTKLPKNSRVFAFCNEDAEVIGFDMLSEPWDTEIFSFRDRRLNVTPEETFLFLTSKGFSYVIFDETCAQKHGDAINGFVQSLGSTNRLESVIMKQGFLLVKVH